MLQLVLVSVLAAALVGLSTLAGRRWGHEVAGLVGAFPLIVGPVLLLTAERQDAAAAAQTAVGTLLGLVTLSGFALVYARSAGRSHWPVSVALGWTAAAALGILVGRIEAGLLGALAAAALSIALARAGLPRREGAEISPVLPRWELPVRMALTVALILGLTAAGERFGPAVAGILAALPTLASVLAVFTHARFGHHALVSLLRGMLGGLGGFVVFCALIALLIEPAGVPLSFALATVAAALTQLGAAAQGSDRGPQWADAGVSRLTGPRKWADPNSRRHGLRGSGRRDSAALDFTGSTYHVPEGPDVVRDSCGQPHCAAPPIQT